MSFTVLAVGAHPDDIEFMMAGTLFLLKDEGCAIHTVNLASGCCGSMRLSPRRAAEARAREARAAAAFLGSTHHPSIAKDLEVFYEDGLIRRATAIMREVDPDILLLPALDDYMEDHVNTARVALTAAFAKGMPNYPSRPRRPAAAKETAVYHALPYGLRDCLGRLVRASSYVDIFGSIDRKGSMLAFHASQKEWLDATQGLGSYIETMKAMSREVGALSGDFECAEGWRRHNSLGFSKDGFDPLRDILGRRLKREGADE